MKLHLLFLPLLLFTLTACDEDAADEAIAPTEYTAEQLELSAEVLATLPPDTASDANGTDRRGRRRRAERCLSFVFPVSLITAEGATVTFDDKEALKEYVKTAEPRRAGTRLVFPLHVTTVDGEVLTIENFRDLKAARRSCAGDREPRPRCYKIDFPIEVVINGETYEIEGPRQLRRAFTRRGDRTEANIVYPITVTEVATGHTLTIEDVAHLNDLRKSCIGD